MTAALEPAAQGGETESGGEPERDEDVPRPADEEDTVDWSEEDVPEEAGSDEPPR